MAAIQKQGPPHIKDLKDLRVPGIAACYRHLGPKGPEDLRGRFLHASIAGDRPPRYGGDEPATVGRGPVPRRGREGKKL